MRVFPQPIKLSPNCTRWRLSELERYETGTSDRTPETERYLSDKQVSDRYEVTRKTVWTWARVARTAAA